MLEQNICGVSIIFRLEAENTCPSSPQILRQQLLTKKCSLPSCSSVYILIFIFVHSSWWNKTSKIIKITCGHVDHCNQIHVFVDQDGGLEFLSWITGNTYA